MSHEIDMSNNRENMVYVGDTPWHRLGTAFDGNEDFDQWRIAAGFNWEAESKALHYKAQPVYLGQDDVNIALPSHKALVRSDTGTVLGVVGKDYKVVQPSDVLGFFKDIAFASDGRYTMETAGCLFDGRRIWALAKTQNEIKIGANDIIKPYLLLGTGFDGKISTFASYTAVRVVCHNTLSMAVGSNCVNADIRITHAQTFNANDVKHALGLIESAEADTLAGFAETANTLAGRPVNDTEVFTYFAGLYGPKREKGQSVQSLRIADFTNSQKRNIDQLIRLFQGGPGAELESSKGTSWGLVNAVTHFEDFKRGKDAQRRLQSAGFGAGANRKKEAVKVALALAA